MSGIRVGSTFGASAAHRTASGVSSRAVRVSGVGVLNFTIDLPSRLKAETPDAREHGDARRRSRHMHRCGATHAGAVGLEGERHPIQHLSLIHISEPTRLGMISYAVFCLKKKKKTTK